MSAANEILTELRPDGVFRITLNRPAKRNAITPAMVASLDHLVAWAAASPTVRVTVITGAGGAFSAGADLAEFAIGGERAAQFVRRGNRMVARLAALGKPAIAAVDGIALGGGFEIALACTVRIASERALFGLQEVTLGLIPAWGGVPNLARMIGPGQAVAAAILGTPLTAVDALARGIVQRMVPASDLAAATDELAAKLAAWSPVALAGIFELAGGANAEREVELFDAALAEPQAAATLQKFLARRAA